MPRKYRRTYRKKKKHYRKGRFSKGNGMRTRMPNNSPLPQRFKALMRYSEPNIRLNPGIGGTLAHNVFSANGIHDPDITNTGHQPMGFDELISMYDHGVVIASKIKVTFTNRDATYAQICGIDLRDSNVVQADARVVIENGTCNYLTLGKSGSSRDTATLTYTCNPNKFLSRSNPLSDPQLKNSTSSNPTEQCFYHVFAGPLESVDAGIVDINVLIEYNTVFFEPKPMALS